MPCSGQSLDRSASEEESARILRLLLWIRFLCQINGGNLFYLGSDIGLSDLPLELQNFDRLRFYGLTKKLDEHTALLCRICKTLPDSFIYNGREKMNRELANWWDEHRILDARRKDKEGEVTGNKVIGVPKEEAPPGAIINES